MSSFNLTDLKVLEQQLLELEHALPGLNATRYLTIVGTVVLFFDLILLLPEEISLIWAADRSISKTLFLINRYPIPILFIFNNYSLGIFSRTSLTTLFCRAWFPFTAALGVTSLAIANFFVMQRVYFLSGRSRAIKIILITAFLIIYFVTYGSVVLTFADDTAQIQYSPIIGSCFISEKPKLLIITYSVPILLDGLVFLLTCYNAFDRPRNIHSILIRQLRTDGLIYFMSLLSLRLFNILSIALGGIQFTLLGVFFIWAVISTLVNRMIITRGVEAIELDPRFYDPTARETPFRPTSYQAAQDRDESEENALWFHSGDLSFRFDQVQSF